ncbi:MAG: polysaccharide deacetylase family protein [Pseudomonadota bacterium]
MDDPKLYDYWPYRNRPKFRWPGEKKLAFWVAPNIEFYELHPPQNPLRKPWPRPNPDIVNYAYRDHGNRVGGWRLFDLMEKYSIPGSVSLSVSMCDHFPDIIETANTLGWEFFSHGAYNTRYCYGMDRDQERASLQHAIDTVKAATGQRIRGYLAPALTHTTQTIELLAELGFQYSCDLFQDDQPQPLNVRTGKLMSMPYSLEVNDHYAFNVFGLTSAQYTDMLKRQFDTLLEEGSESGTVMCIPLHAYLISRAHRIGPFEEILKYADAHRDDVWITRACDIADYFNDHVYDAALENIAAQQGSEHAA